MSIFAFFFSITKTNTKWSEKINNYTWTHSSTRWNETQMKNNYESMFICLFAYFFFLLLVSSSFIFSLYTIFQNNFSSFFYLFLFFFFLCCIVVTHLLLYCCCFSIYTHSKFFFFFAFSSLWSKKKLLYFFCDGFLQYQGDCTHIHMCIKFWLRERLLLLLALLRLSVCYSFAHHTTLISLHIESFGVLWITIVIHTRCVCDWVSVFVCHSIVTCLYSRYNYSSGSDSSSMYVLYCSIRELNVVVCFLV